MEFYNLYFNKDYKRIYIEKLLVYIIVLIIYRVLKKILEVKFLNYYFYYFKLFIVEVKFVIIFCKLIFKFRNSFRNEIVLLL